MPPGTVVGGKFVIDTLVGSGAMSLVYRARHSELDEYVALKFLRRGWQDNGEIRARFTREAKAVAKLTSEHAARVLDVARTDDGVPFLVMEYLEGEDLGATLNRGRVAVRDGVDWTIEACDALAEAHVHGIVHRDVKPENLFLVRRHGRLQVKLLDFGVSKMALTGAVDSRVDVSKTTSLIGTPLYMAPEQVRTSASSDARSDIWALGAVLYELLAGRPPFLADTLPEVCALILEGGYVPLAALRPDVSEDLSAIVDRCLTKNADQRFQSVADLALALLPFAHPRKHADVERLTRIQRLAGLSSAQVASIPPSPDGSLLPEIPRQSAVPVLEPEPRRAPSPALSSSSAPVSTTSSHPTKPSRRWLVAVLILLGVAAGTLLAVFRGHATATAGPPAGSATPPAPAKATTAAETPAPAATPSTEQGDVAPEPSASAPSKGTTERPSARKYEPRREPLPAKPAKPAEPAEAPPPTKPKLEIRLER